MSSSRAAWQQTLAVLLAYLSLLLVFRVPVVFYVNDDMLGAVEWTSVALSIAFAGTWYDKESRSYGVPSNRWIHHLLAPLASTVASIWLFISIIIFAIRLTARNNLLRPSSVVSLCAPLPNLECLKDVEDMRWAYKCNGWFFAVLVCDAVTSAYLAVLSWAEYRERSKARSNEQKKAADPSYSAAHDGHSSRGELINSEVGRSARGDNARFAPTTETPQGDLRTRAGEESIGLEVIGATRLPTNNLVQVPPSLGQSGLRRRDPSDGVIRDE